VPLRQHLIDPFLSPPPTPTLLIGGTRSAEFAGLLASISLQFTQPAPSPCAELVLRLGVAIGFAGLKAMNAAISPRCSSDQSIIYGRARLASTQDSLYFHLALPGPALFAPLMQRLSARIFVTVTIPPSLVLYDLVVPPCYRPSATRPSNFEFFDCTRTRNRDRPRLLQQHKACARYIYRQGIQHIFGPRPVSHLDPSA